ncbi:unnamed protein product [Camellia sinensis]
MKLPRTTSLVDDPGFSHVDIFFASSHSLDVSNHGFVTKDLVIVFSLPFQSNRIFPRTLFRRSGLLKEALEYAKSVELGEDAKDVWVFDIDETLLSNVPYYADHGFGQKENITPLLEVFDGVEFDKWVDKAMAPPIESNLKLYEEVLKLGLKVFLLTRGSEQQRGVTVANLINSGFQDWDKLILRATEDHGKLATIYKPEKRNEMVEEGYRILGNSGDQWSDLLGSSVSIHSFKLPNPMYYIP